VYPNQAILLFQQEKSIPPQVKCEVAVSGENFVVIFVSFAHKFQNFCQI
jgi:hypothetical protein